MTTATLDPQAPLTEARDLLLEIDRQLHEVIDYTNDPDFDPVRAAQLMDRFGDVYQDLGYHRFTDLLLSLDAQPSSAADDPSKQPTDDPCPDAGRG
jgi:hypothetical protein